MFLGRQETSLFTPVTLMNKNGFTVIEIIIVMVILGIIAAIAIPNLTRNKITSNENTAKGIVRLISSAAENYAAVNNSSYPTAESDLTGATPPYLEQSYCGQNITGYSYSCAFAVGSYTVTATPLSCGKTGSKIYTGTQGGTLSETDC